MQYCGYLCECVRAYCELSNNNNNNKRLRNAFLDVQFNFVQMVPFHIQHNKLVWLFHLNSRMFKWGLEKQPKKKTRAN